MPFTLRIRDLLPRLDDILNYTIDQLHQVHHPPQPTTQDGKYNPWTTENMDIDYAALERTVDLAQRVLDLYDTVKAMEPPPHGQLRRFTEPFPPEAIWTPLPEPWEPVRPAPVMGEAGGLTVAEGGSIAVETPTESSPETEKKSLSPE